MAPTEYWAVLIGINRYPEKPLNGCVADVQMIQQYLESDASGSKPITILSFQTDRAIEDDGAKPDDISEIPLALRAREHNPGFVKSDVCLDHSTEPQPATHSNILAGFEVVIENASGGDFVYVHYSGHGTTIKFPPSRLVNKVSGDLALVLYDPDSPAKIKHLPGRVLAGFLRRMVEKGLHVTLVLDCCFSGSVVRSGDSSKAVSRVLPYNPSADGNEEDHSLQFHVEEETFHATYRTLNILPRWLVEPNGYTILTACGSDEFAKEIIIGESQYHGALSYFIMQALVALRKRSHRSLYHQVRAQFFEHWPQQNPLRFGNGNDAFFATSISQQTSMFVPVFRHNNGVDLCLGVGLAHGVCVGDEYAIYKPDAPEERGTSSAKACTTMKVTKAGAVTSVLLEQPLTPAMYEVETGWKGKALTSFQTRRILVAIQDEIFDQTTWAKAMSETRFCRAFSTADASAEHPAIFVAKNECSELEICDSSCKVLKSVPGIPQQTKHLLDCVAHLVDHIATYQNILRIGNRNSPTSLLSTFVITVLDASGNELCPDFVELVHGDKLTIRICNVTENPLHVGICYLDGLWGIVNLLSHDGSGEYIKVLPQSEESLPIIAGVPDQLSSRGQTYCDDTLKIFVTAKPTSFEPLEMDPLPEQIDSLASIPTRGSRPALSQLLSRLSAPSRSSSDDILDESWTCRDIIVRTHRTQAPFK